MSYELKLFRQCNHKIYDETQVVEHDGVTVTLKKPMVNDDVLVKVNGYEFPRYNLSEIEKIDNITSKFTGNNSIFHLNDNYIYTGQNFGTTTNNPSDLIIKIKQENENVSHQFSGSENFFVTSHNPLLSIYNFTSNIYLTDIDVKINNNTVKILDVDSLTGRVQIDSYPTITDVVTVTYYYKAQVLTLNGTTGLVTIKEKPKLGQEVKAKYFIRVHDGWVISNEKTIVFDRVRKTNRGFAVENVSSQFTGVERQAYVSNIPLMPFEVDMDSSPSDTLVNSVSIEVNGTTYRPKGINSETGLVVLPITPDAHDVVIISYNYQNNVTPDIIGVDYATGINVCPKCNGIGMYDDLQYDGVGLVMTVENEDKLIQDLRKLIITIKGSNKEHIWYGTNLEKLVGQSLLMDFVKTQILAEVHNAYQDMKSLQVQQENYQLVTDREFMNYLDNIKVEQNTANKNLWTITCDVINQAGTFVELREEILFESPLFQNLTF